MRLSDRPGLVTLHVVATTMLAVGFAALAVAVWSLFITVDDGGGANIGGGILAMFGLLMGCAGLVVLAVAAVGAALARRR